MRIMGIDYGTKRIGVSLSDELGMMAHAHDTVECRDSVKDMEAIKGIIKDNDVAEVVVGFPLSMDGT